MNSFERSCLKTLYALPGAAIFLGLFWLICSVFGWEPPAWAWFLVGWIGHNDFYDALTYKRDDGWTNQ